MTIDQSRHAATGPDLRSTTVVTALLDHGLLAAENRQQALAVVHRSLEGQGPPAAPLKRRFAELAGYLGGAFIVSAAAILSASRWPTLTEGEQVALLGGVALLLAVAGLAVGGMGAGIAALRGGVDPVRRRLCGVLLVGAAAAAGSAVGLHLARTSESFSTLPPAVGFGTLAAVALLGYLVAPTVLGQVAVAGGLTVMVPTALEHTGGAGMIPVGLIWLALGATWLVLAEREVWREVGSARVIGCVLALAGAQTPAFEYDDRWVGYLLLGLVAAAAFAAYVVRPAWPYLATGVVAVTLAVPQALLDWTDGAVGPAGVLLASGVTLLVASLLGLRLRKEVSDALV
jgi:hypothetical protein